MALAFRPERSVVSVVLRLAARAAPAMTHEAELYLLRLEDRQEAACDGHATSRRAFDACAASFGHLDEDGFTGIQHLPDGNSIVVVDRLDVQNIHVAGDDNHLPLGGAQLSNLECKSAALQSFAKLVRRRQIDFIVLEIGRFLLAQKLLVSLRTPNRRYIF